MPYRVTEMELLNAASQGDVAAVEKCLMNGVDPNALVGRNSAPFLTCFAGGDYPNAEDLIEVLLEKGANPNLADENGVTPLHEAVGANNLASAEILLEYKANINAQTKDGTTLLHAAVYYALRTDDQLPVIWALNHGADSAIKNHAGKTALDEARQWNEDGIVNCFLAYDPKSKRQGEIKKQDAIVQQRIDRLKAAPMKLLKKKSGPSNG